MDREDKRVKNRSDLDFDVLKRLAEEPDEPKAVVTVIESKDPPAWGRREDDCLPGRTDSRQHRRRLQRGGRAGRGTFLIGAAGTK